MAKRNPRQGLFNGYWLTPELKKLRRIRRDEYPELYRLWAKHKDVREGAEPLVWQGVKRLGERSVLHG